MVHWWLFTWKFIGLNSASQAFDLVMLTHPAAVSKLPDECILVEDSFKIDFTSKGKCLYKPYLGIAYRDKTYDPYMNSQVTEMKYFGQILFFDEVEWSVCDLKSKIDTI